MASSYPPPAYPQDAYPPPPPHQSYQASAPYGAAPPPQYAAAGAGHYQHHHHGANDFSDDDDDNDNEKPSYADLSSSQPLTSATAIFPPTFTSHFQRKILTKTMHICVDKKQPLFAVEMHSGLTSKPVLVLHSGPSSDHDPVLATVKAKSKLSQDFYVTFPAGGGQQQQQRQGQGEQETSEFVESHLRLKKSAFDFSVEVGNTTTKDTRRRREAFQWRFTYGNEIKAIAGRGTSGWKLVRMSSSSSSSSSSSEDNGGGSSSSSNVRRKDRNEGVTSDGKEVVAVWAHNTGWSGLTQAFKFAFVGEGLGGTLGPRWETMAVMSALRLWYYEYNSAAASSASSSSAAAAVAVS